MRRSTLPLIVALATAALGGCGGNDDESPADIRPDERAEVVESVKALQTAALDRDANAYCDRLAGDLKRDMTARMAPLGVKTCEGAASKAFKLGGGDEFAEIRESRDRLDVGSVRLVGDRATVTLPSSGRRMSLVQAGGDWYVSKLPGN